MDPTTAARAQARQREADLAGELRAVWPVPAYDPGRGYAAVSTAGLELIDALPLGSQHAVAVVRDPGHAVASRPLVRDGSRWRVAGPGDGTASALLTTLADPARGVTGAFVGSWDGPAAPAPRAERSLVADQTNVSVIVGDAAIVKWRVAFHTQGTRGVTLRRHLAANGFDAVPPLLGALSWAGPHGEVTLADVDTMLPAAIDGWDYALDLLVPYARGVRASPPLGAMLGGLTARLHVALSRPSGWIPDPQARVRADEIVAWQAAARSAVESAVAIEADDLAVVVAARPRLEAAIDRLADIDDVVCSPIHGDLHLGQLVAWAGGLAVIDFDGPPWHAADPPSEAVRSPVARDVAQLLVSLDLLAVAADRRTDGRARDRLTAWAREARQAFLACYRDEAAGAGSSELLDQRLLSPFIAEQLCRELLYADAALPRWRYAPVGALAWLYEESTT